MRVFHRDDTDAPMGILGLDKTSVRFIAADFLAGSVHKTVLQCVYGRRSAHVLHCCLDVEGSGAEVRTTLIARMDKMPPYLIATEKGNVAVVIEKGDSPAMVKIKQFMAMYGIVDIKMRMLRIQELKLIMGFPEDYILIGTQAEQKKFIGNAVETNQAKAMTTALAKELSKPQYRRVA